MNFIFECSTRYRDKIHIHKRACKKYVTFIFVQRLYMKVKSDHSSKFSNLGNWKEEAWKYQGFNRIRTRDLRDTGAMLDQRSCEATHRKLDLFFWLHISPCSEMMWNICEIHICTAVANEGKEWSSQQIFEFKQLEGRWPRISKDFRGGSDDASIIQQHMYL